IITAMTVLLAKNNDKVDYSMILPMANWMFLFFGLLVVIKTITRDYSQGTIQLYMNKVKNRVGYVIAKTISIIIFSFIFTLITYVTLLVIQTFTDGKNLNGDKFLTNIWFYLIFLLFFGLLLFLITLIVQKPAVIFTLGIFLVFIVPFLQPFLGLIPEWGDNIQKSLKYIPFSYLTEKSSSGSIKFTNWQWFISIASIVILFIADVLYAAKRDI
ncbi:phenol-soluble modulin export ABC transporter permease subunit PmtD, partial [Staphylococcus hominis]